MAHYDTDADVFDRVWPGGYVETFEGYVNVGCAKYREGHIAAVLGKFFNRQHTCLEIGPGGGLWTRKYLIPNFRQVIALDVVSQKFGGKLKYIRVPNRDFSCHGVDDGSIDFLFSFGCFCHLSVEAQSEYLRSAYRKMRDGAFGLVMFANFDRHPNWNKMSAEERRAHEGNRNPEGAVWFYNDLATTRKMIEEAGFRGFYDCMPDFRDTLAAFQK